MSTCQLTIESLSVGYAIVSFKMSKLSILKVHVHSDRHKNGKDARRMEEERQQMVKASF